LHRVSCSSMLFASAAHLAQQGLQRFLRVEIDRIKRDAPQLSDKARDKRYLIVGVPERAD
jgi:hypothetical protein